jgi:predicted RNA-binding Zn-ribbon protein involved in translation (DUF1610 family)
MEEKPVKKSKTGCPACGNLIFRLEEAQTDDRSLELYMIKCNSCNTVVGVYDKSMFDLLDKISASLV